MTIRSCFLRAIVNSAAPYIDIEYLLNGNLCSQWVFYSIVFWALYHLQFPYVSKEDFKNNNFMNTKKKTLTVMLL